MPADLLPLIDQIRTLLQSVEVDIGPDVKLIQALLWLDDVRARVEKMAVQPPVPVDPEEEHVARLWAEPEAS